MVTYLEIKEVCDNCELNKEVYEVIEPFDLYTIYLLIPRLSFSNLLAELRTDRWRYWPVSCKFVSFGKDVVPNTIWENRHIFEQAGFIKPLDNSVVLKPGMKLVYNGLVDMDELVVCEVSNHQLNLFCTTEWNRWTNEGFPEGTTLQQLNNSVEHGQFYLKEE